MSLNMYIAISSFQFQIRNTSRNSNLTDLLNNDQLRNDLFLPIISVAAMSPFEFNPCCSEKLREECIRAKEKFDRMSVRHIYGSIEGKYNRLAVPRHFDKIKLLAYDSETFANRFMVRVTTLFAHFVIYFP
jgi:hypothetical protein